MQSHLSSNTHDSHTHAVTAMQSHPCSHTHHVCSPMLPIATIRCIHALYHEIRTGHNGSSLSWCCVGRFSEKFFNRLPLDSNHEIGMVGGLSRRAKLRRPITFIWRSSFVSGRQQQQQQQWQQGGSRGSSSSSSSSSSKRHHPPHPLKMQQHLAATTDICSHACTMSGVRRFDKRFGIKLFVVGV